MSEQDVGIRISANTTEAQQSIQDLESTLNGMQDLQQKGIGQGFLNDDDIQHFQTLSDQATQIYQNFYRNYEQIIDNLNDKKNQLRQQISQSSDQTEIDELKHRVNDIDLQRVTYSSQRTMADNMNSQQGTVFQGSQPYINGTFSESNPNSPSSSSPSSTAGNNGVGGSNRGNGSGNGSGNRGSEESSSSGGGLSSGLGRISSFISAITGFSQIRSGMQQINNQESEMAQLGTRTGGFGNRFDLGRVTAGRVGYANGYTSGQTIDLANEYASLAGVTSPFEMWSRVGNIQSQSRQLGLSATQLGQSEGQMTQIGALGSTADQQQFADMIAGAVKQDNMQGRQSEFVQSTTSLASQAANGQANFTNSQLQNVIGLQATVGQAGRMFQGQNGAQILGNMNSQIQGNSSSMQIMLGMGTRYQGVSGLLQEQRMAAQGISNPQNLSRVFKYAQHNISGEDNQEEAIMGTLGLTAPQADALYRNRRIRKEIESGNMSSQEIKNLIKQGSSTNDQNEQNYNSSNAGQRARNEAGWSQVQQSSAGPFDWAMREAGSFFSNPITWGLGGLGLGASALFGGKGLVGGLGRLFRGSGSGFGGRFGGLGKDFGEAWNTTKGMWNGSTIGRSVNEDIGGLGHWFSGTRAGQAMSGMFGRFSGSKFGNAAGDFAQNWKRYLNPKNLMDQAGRDLKSFGRVGSEGMRGFGDVGGLGSLLRGAGKFLGPIGEFQMFNDASKAAGGLSDWMFGHKKGENIASSGLNPFKVSDGKYSTAREGAIEKAWNWATGSNSDHKSSYVNAGLLTPKQEKDLNKELNSRENDLEDKRKENLSNREKLDNQEEQDLQKRDQKKDSSNNSNNTNSISRLLGGNSSGTGMNWLGQMFRGVGNFFQNLFGGGGSSSSSNSSSSSISGSKGTAAYQKNLQAAEKKYNIPASAENDLNYIIGKESGFNPTAKNSSSTAEGYGQLLSGTRQEIEKKTGVSYSNGENQIYDTYEYAIQRYGSVEKAAEHEKKYHWYANGTNYSSSGNAVVSEGNSPEIVTSPSGESVLSTKQTSFYNFMSGSTVTPLNKLSSLNGVNWNQSSSIMQAISQLARVSATGAASSGNKTISIKVSGSINGLTKENNDQVANSIAGYFSGSPMAYSFSRK